MAFLLRIAGFCYNLIVPCVQNCVRLPRCCVDYIRLDGPDPLPRLLYQGDCSLIINYFSTLQSLFFFLLNTLNRSGTVYLSPKLVWTGGGVGAGRAISWENKEKDSLLICKKDYLRYSVTTVLSFVVSPSANVRIP
jgi:hypothetical protein